MKHRHLVFLLAALSMMGALSIDTYLPAMPAIAGAFHTTLAAVNQTLSAFLLGSAVMTLFHGTLSDSFGRKPVMVAFLVVYVLTSIGAACSVNLSMLIFFRLVQGACSGAGGVIGRAMIADLYKGPEAQRLMAFIFMIFGLAPAIAPVLGGWLQAALGWRSIFWFIASFSFITLLVTLRELPETLPHHQRHPFHLKAILQAYWRVGGNPRLLARSLGSALCFTGVSIYIGSAAAFVINILHQSEKSFAWMFIPLIGGMISGSTTAARIAHVLPPSSVIRIGYGIMLLGAAWNVTYNVLSVAAVPWAVVPLFVYCFGMSLASSAQSIVIFGMFSTNRGLVSSFTSFIFTATFSLVTGLVCPLLFGSALHLAEGVLVGAVLSLVMWQLGGAVTEPTNACIPVIETAENQVAASR